uniref:Protein farnesyltransferase subunit beta n=1 Tax=Lygus hesperus TaxID=30085 RepID=A0A0A9WUE7_LYGHE
MELLGMFDQQDNPYRKMLAKCAEKLLAMQHEDGGFSGGEQQKPHVLTTYAAVMALIICGTYGEPNLLETILQQINRTKLLEFYSAMKCKDVDDSEYGGFHAHEDGEVDLRTTYCTIAVASILNLLPNDTLTQGVAQFIQRCQGFDGGLAGTPSCESHAGYTYCGVATLALLNQFNYLDTQALLRWIGKRQHRYEGGFDGRPNKLVDGCYSFWVGAVFAILITSSHSSLDASANIHTGWLYNQRSLQQYILIHCQYNCNNTFVPGLCDKPSTAPDLYHTCYCLSGLTLAQRSPINSQLYIYGDPNNLINPTDPVYNISPSCVEAVSAVLATVP